MKRGFTIIEITTVVLVLMILVVIAVPSFLRSRSVANEGIAMANLKVLSDACQLYRTNKNIYPQSLSDLVPPASNPTYIDPILASGTKQGYNFVYSRNDEGFSIRANPQSLGRYYYIDETGNMRVNATEEAGASDAAAQQ
ncbi:MAG: hypothetical protein PHT31_04740 [Candidatus Omnitrophica bacterium]|nr:hypothetical protein [Candidatus Omnitrophota bacterium]MDD5653453.1 hypothetical protein [Candidatus Omnitrophota bacterium]